MNKIPEYKELIPISERSGVYIFRNLSVVEDIERIKLEGVALFLMSTIEPEPSEDVPGDLDE